MQADAYANPLIDAGELARELEVIIQEAKRKADNPGAVTTETLFELLHDRHRIRRWRIGREPGLRRADARAMLVRFYRNFYHPRQHDACRSSATSISTRRCGTCAGSTARSRPAPVARIAGPEEDGADRLPLSRVARRHRRRRSSRSAGGRSRTLHERHAGARPRRHGCSARDARRGCIARCASGKLASSVTAYNYTPTDARRVRRARRDAGGAARPAARAIWDQVRDDPRGRRAAQEVERAKRVYESRWVRRLEDMEGQANYLAEWEALGDWRLGDRYFERDHGDDGTEVTRSRAGISTPEQAGWSCIVRRRAPEVAARCRRRCARCSTTRAPALVAAGRRSRPRRAATAVARLRRSEREEGGVRVYRTAAGVPMLVRRRPGAPIVHAGVYMLGGARDEPPRSAGLTRCSSRTALKGTDAPRRTADRRGGRAARRQSWARRDGGGFGWTISVPARRAAGDRAARGRRAAPDDPGRCARDRARDRAGELVARCATTCIAIRCGLATQAAFGGHPYGALARWDGEHVRRDRRRATVRDWHRERVLESPAVIAVVGDVDRGAGGARGGAFTELRGGDVAPLARAARGRLRPCSVVEQRDKAQTALALAFAGPARADDARFATAMIAGVASGLGGRFFDELRDKQSLGYTVQAFASERALAGTFVSYIATSPEQEEVARRGLLDEFAKFRERQVTRRSWSARRRMRSACTRSVSRAAARCSARSWTRGCSATAAELEEYDAQVRAVTGAAMRAAAERYFVEDRRVEGIVRGVAKTV